MSSPFPGMNPYLEQGAVRQDFHVMFLAAIKERLAPQVRHKYIVKLEEYVYIHDQPPEPRQLAGRADLAVAASPLMSKEPGAVGVLEAPAQVELVAQDVELARFLEVRDRQGGEPITVLELLSPSNKRPGDGRDRYLAKRGRLSVSGAHLVEIDLLRGGQPMPLWNRPECAYSVLVSRAEERPRAGFWPIGLKDRLPEIPIPLRAPDGDARMDLQDVLHRVYDANCYEDFIYNGSPEPPLAPEDAEWARGLVPAAR